MAQNITEEMVFQKAMTSDFTKVENLSLVGLRITSVTYGVSTLRRLSNLKEVNLANNKISQISSLSELKGLQTLILMGNRIKEIGALNLPVLTSLNLDNNQITAVSGLRGLKKLEDLSLENNFITDASMQDVGFTLINL